MRGVLLPALLVVGAGSLALAAPWRAAQPAAPIPSERPPARIVYPAGRRPVLTLPDGERRTVFSLLNVAGPLRFGQYAWDEQGVPPGPIWVRVDLGRQLLSVFRAGHEIGTAVILYGADGRETPLGVFPVLEKAIDHRSSSYDADMPYMLRLTGDGVAIHASDVRAGVATHGCIGVPIAFARLLFAHVQRHDPVAIIGPATTA